MKLNTLGYVMNYAVMWIKKSGDLGEIKFTCEDEARIFLSGIPVECEPCLFDRINPNFMFREVV